MYKWKKMTPEQRAEAIKRRKARGYPWHGPPHRITRGRLYHISATCYEHQPIIGKTFERMAEFEEELLSSVTRHAEQVLAWCVLPNHYHLHVDTPRIREAVGELGQLHGRTSFRWNGEENRRGRKCWHRCADRAIRSERHNWATLNYVLHNPVHHGYVRRWQDWPFSSARKYLKEVGREKALQRWRDYPLLDYGKGWDDPDL
ncbi:hypothetical protein [Desulfonema magnum]|uniref:Transposase IS200-like domain-containing protein n=1 Tax=Desulfonema magnum TaxID=45655 RepID=A0A975BPV5_9BACT|nr:hypothetical protein [Desulfonema magnum]QTA88989.1 Transposase IS200-like domain-containing protein [Desulfonema magnum]